MRCLLAFGCLTLLLVPGSLRAQDWTFWRGPAQTGVSNEVNLPAKFSIDPKAKDSNLVWKAPYGSRSTPIVMNGRVYINNQVGEGVNEQERVMCLDADNGKVLWEKRFGVWHTDIVSARLGWTNLAADPKTENIYWHGTQGLLICFDKNGKQLWQRSLTEEFGRVSGYGGRISSPTVDGDLVIIGMLCHSWGDLAKGGDRYLALDKKTGDIIWWYESPNMFYATYSSCPSIAVINGQRLLITGCGDGGIHAVKVRSGEPVWNVPVAKGLIYNSPLVSGNFVFMAHGALNHGTNLSGGVFCFDASQLDKGKPKLVWKKLKYDCKYASPLLHEDRLYVATDIARLLCFDAKTGDKLWKEPLIYGRNAMASPVWADGKIYLAAVNGEFCIIEPGKNEGKILHTQEFPSPDGVTAVECDASVAVSNGRIYLGTTESLYCIGKDGHSSKAKPAPSLAEESPVGPAVALRVEPAEVTLYAGDKANFTVKAMDANGRVLADEKMEGTWSLPVPPSPAIPKTETKPAPFKGKLTGTGATAELVADSATGEQWGVVEFKGKLGTAKARVRIVPKLPYKQDFNAIADGYAPPSWSNAQGKFWVVTLDGEKVLRNNNKGASPVIHNANAYIGKPDLTGYTIESDIMGTEVNGSIADMGIINNRYRLVLKGNQNNLRIEAWDAMPRVAVDVDFAIKPKTWYRLKFKVEVSEGGKEANLFGKAWERGQPEPKDWTVAFTDPNPYTEGCPGLFSYAKSVREDQAGTDVYFDNVVILPNKK